MKSHEHETTSPPLWRNHNYLFLQGGQLVSSIGNQQQSIALPLLVLALTGSVVQVGIAVSLSTIAVLVVSPLAGALADQWDRKRTMVICDAGRMFLTLTIPLAFWLHMLTMLQLYVVVTIAGILGTMFSSANTATLPNVVTSDQLPVALSQSQAAYSCVRTFGSLLGGTLYGLGEVFPFLVNAVSFGVSVLSQQQGARPCQRSGVAVLRVAATDDHRDRLLRGAVAYGYPAQMADHLYARLGHDSGAL